MKRTATLACLAAVLLASCATTTPPQAPQNILAQLSARGVPTSTVKRIDHGRVLDFSDILALAKAGVSDRAAVAYLKSTRAKYSLTTAQLEQLSDAGAGSALVNYLGKSAGYYEATRADQLGGPKLPPDPWLADPYFADPAFWGAAPFPYAFPGEWADPGFVFDTF
ncbi:MAG: hypothetical protein ACOYNG_05900 [Terrimicrobiaceae bacterium]